MAPLVSVGMPVRNGAEYIEIALRSLLAQTFRDFEVIISDNASNDDTRAICEAYASDDSRVRYHCFENNVGAARNYNHVFGMAQGRYFKWAAHDDVCLPMYLEKCVEALSSVPSAVLVYPRTQLIDASGRIIGSDEFGAIPAEPQVYRRLEWFLRHVQLVNPVCGVIRRSALEKTRLIGSFCSSDKVLMAELLMLGQCVELPEVLFQRRLHDKRSTQANRTRRELLAWFDPAKRDSLQIISADRRLTFEYIASVYRMPLSIHEKARCLVSLTRCRIGTRMQRACQSYGRRIMELVAPK